MSPGFGPQAGQEALRVQGHTMGSLGGSSGTAADRRGRPSGWAPQQQEQTQASRLVADGRQSGAIGLSLGMRSGCDNDLEEGGANEARHLNQRPRRELPDLRARGAQKSEAVDEQPTGCNRRCNVDNNDEVDYSETDSNNDNGISVRVGASICVSRDNRARLTADQLPLSDNRRRTRSRRFPVVSDSQHQQHQQQATLGESPDHHNQPGPQESGEAGDLFNEIELNKTTSKYSSPVNQLAARNSKSPRSRERSSSITSDYFSSNQSSPQAIVRLAAGKPTNSQLYSSEVATSPISYWRRQPEVASGTHTKFTKTTATTIYENPAFGRDESHDCEEASAAAAADRKMMLRSKTPQEKQQLPEPPMDYSNNISGGSSASAGRNLDAMLVASLSNGTGRSGSSSSRRRQLNSSNYSNNSSDSRAAITRPETAGSKTAANANGLYASHQSCSSASSSGGSRAATETASSDADNTNSSASSTRSSSSGPRESRLAGDSARPDPKRRSADRRSASAAKPGGHEGAASSPAAAAANVKWPSDTTQRQHHVASQPSSSSPPLTSNLPSSRAHQHHQLPFGHYNQHAPNNNRPEEPIYREPREEPAYSSCLAGASQQPVLVGGAGRTLVGISARQTVGKQQQQQQPGMEPNSNGHYYYAGPNHRLAHGGSGEAGGQSGSLSTCDEASNTDESQRSRPQQQQQQQQHYLQQQPHSSASSSDYHYYQVVVPEREPIASSYAQGGRHTTQSPCKSIQRIVSSLFAAADQPAANCPPPIPTINQNLVSSEPLIRSSSWQNKTHIDLRLQQQQQPPQPSHYLESSLIQKTLPCNNNSAAATFGPARYAQFPPTLAPAIELSSIANQQQQHYANQAANDHYYYGLGTLRRHNQPATGELVQRHIQQSPLSPPPPPPDQLHYKTSLSQSFHTLTDNKMDLRLCYQLPHHLAQSAGDCAQQFSGLSGPVRPNHGSKLKRPIAYLLGLDYSTKLCLVLIIMLASGCLLLAALLSPPPSFANQPNNHNWNRMQQQLGMSQAEPGGARSTWLPPQMPPIPGATSGGAIGWLSSNSASYQERGATNQQVQLAPDPASKVTPPDSDKTGSATTTTPPPLASSTVRAQTTAAPQLEASTQRYWMLQSEMDQQDRCLDSLGTECSLKGQCNGGTCFCYSGYSGPTCAIANCPNECSRNGECKLKQDSTLNYLGAGVGSGDSALHLGARLQSVGFQTSQAARSRNSACPKPNESELNMTWALHGPQQPSTYDNRLEWACVCDLGYTGPDCSQPGELLCDNKQDDDNDGLIDCEDEDCCSQPVCNVNHMCFKSPEPMRALEMWRTNPPQPDSDQQQKLPQTYLSNYTRSQRFFAQLRFMIQGPKSVQSYAKERAFDRTRVSVIKGRVVKWRSPPNHNHQQGIVSVRVSVAENPEFGFTLTREDGHFDMLVNGDEWITLQFNKNNYAPIKRKLLARSNSFVLLEEGLEMWLSASPASAASASSGGAGVGSAPTADAVTQTERTVPDPAFNLQLGIDIHKLVWASRRDDERKRNLLFDCMIGGIQQLGASSFRVQHRPVLLEENPLAGTYKQTLKAFALASSGAFRTTLDREANGLSQQLKPQIVYNSAFFPPAASVVKTSVSIQLLDQGEEAADDSNGQVKLRAVQVQLDIEGQSRRERLAPQSRLIYQFAWNRRNVYHQKVYGFGELNVRIGYEYELKLWPSANRSLASLWADCLTSLDGSQQQQAQNVPPGSSAALDKLKVATFSASSPHKRVVWFEQKIYMEAHHLNQHSDLGKWTLDESNRLDQHGQLIYFGSGWSLPYKLAYPPIVSEPIRLLVEGGDETMAGAGDLGPAADLARPPEVSTDQAASASTTSGSGSSSRLMSRGPNSSMFVLLHPKHAPLTSSQLVQLDSTGRRRLLDVPLSILASKLGLVAEQFGGSANRHQPVVDDIQLLYNDYLSTLYLGSKAAAKMVQVSYASLLVLNRTLTSGAATAAGADDAIDIEPLCGFGRQTLGSNSPAEAMRQARLVRLAGPHSMTLDEERQILYFIDGPGSLMALDLTSQRLTLLSVFGSSGRRSSAAASSLDYLDQTGSGTARPPNNSACSRRAFQVPLGQYRMHHAHSLTWSRADSSLYFVDQNLIFALRQDFNLELVAAGPAPAARTATAAHLHNLAPTCFSASSRLGNIKSLQADEINGDLLVVHQPISDKTSGGHLYLAKLKLSAATAATAASGGSPQWWTPALIDLHSASSAWDPMIWRLADGQMSMGAQRRLNGTAQLAEIKWHELANPAASQQQPSSVANSSGQQSKKTTTGQLGAIKRRQIPFIHLSTSGFRGIDSVEINPTDGSIFVLDSSTNSIRLVAPYDPNEFNLVERSDVNINRLFAANSLEAPSPSSSISAQPDGLIQQQQWDLPHTGSSDQGDSGEGRKLMVLIVQNPISGELMEFHSSSGLQLSLTSPKGIKSEFYYRILTNNKMVELDEDDKYDFDVQKTILDYMMTASGGSSSEGNPPRNHLILNQINGAYIRLNKILDSIRNEYELVRLYTGSRFVLQSILLNHQPMCEVATDYSGALNIYQQPGKNHWVEILYDTSTYLIRDMIIKTDGVQSNQQQANRDLPGSRPYDNSYYNSSLLGPTTKDWRQLKRIVYDRVFQHYCDMFIVNA